MPQIDTKKLEAYAQMIFERESQFNDYTLKTIARRVKATGQLSAHNRKGLKNMADISDDMKAITKELARITEMNIEDIETVYAQVINDGINTYKPIYDFKGMKLAPTTQNDRVMKLVRHWTTFTAENMVNLSRTKSIGFTDSSGRFTDIQGAFQRIIDDAVAAVSSGVTDFNSAMRLAIEQLGGSGVVVNYGNGVTRSIEGMVRQNLFWGAKQVAQSYDEYVSEELGLDGFEVDAHSGCRPSHEFMQGKMYSYQGDKVINGVLYEEGKEALERLKDYGCLHFKTGVLLGVSEPRYSKEELVQIHKESTEKIEYEGREKTLYEWKQTQRRLEREYRKAQTQSDMFKESGNDIKAEEYKSKATAIKTTYDDLADKMPRLYNNSERMRTYFAEEKPLTSGGDGGKIKEKSTNKITPITDNAISNVKRVEIDGFDTKQNDYIHSQHKELLQYAKDNNESKEVAFVFRNDLSDKNVFKGNDDSVDFGNALTGKGSGLFVMHNHPNNSSFSDRDIHCMLSDKNIKSISVVKNNGDVEVLTKSAEYDEQKAITQLRRAYKKYVKNNSDEEITKALDYFLKHNGGNFLWAKE